MAKQLQRGRITAEVVFETSTDNYGRTKSYGVSSLKGAFRSIKNANIAIALFDENGEPIGVDITGKPSEEMRRLMDEVFGDEEPVPEVATG